jgi:hypothetical protein
MLYKLKYLKYKNKYLDLKNKIPQKGGSSSSDVDDENDFFVNGNRGGIPDTAEEAIRRMHNMLRTNRVKDINVRGNAFGETALISCILTTRPIAATLTIMEWLLTRIPPININLQCMGNSAIAWAIGHKKSEIVRLLLNYGADISTKDVITVNGRKSLIYDSLARRETLPDIRELLLQHRLNPPTEEQICQRADVFRLARGEAARGLIRLPDFIPYRETEPFEMPELYP